MKMRTVNHITAAVQVIASILVLIAVLTGEHTLFGTIAASVAMAVSLGCYLRVVVGTAALKIEEKKEELIHIAIAQRRDPAVVTEFAKWIRENDLGYRGAMIVDLADAISPEGKVKGYWLLLVGTRSVFDRIHKECANAAVLDYWPINRDKWADKILEHYLKYDVEEPTEDDTIPELKG